MHPALALGLELTRTCRCSHSGGGLGSYLIVTWLWRQIGWWSIPVYLAAAALLGLISAALGSSSSDCD